MSTAFVIPGSTKAGTPVAPMNCGAPPWNGAKPQPKVEPMLPSATERSTASSRQRGHQAASVSHRCCEKKDTTRSA